MTPSTPRLSCPRAVVYDLGVESRVLSIVIGEGAP